MECPDDTDDVHLCGRCRSTFGDLNEFVNHKKECRKKPNNNLGNIIKAEDHKDITNVDLNMTCIDGKDTNNDLNLATDEAAVISLLANQLSSQNTKNANDDLEQLTLVFKEELEAIEQNKPNILRPAKNHLQRKKPPQYKRPPLMLKMKKVLKLVLMLWKVKRKLKTAPF